MQREPCSWPSEHGCAGAERYLVRRPDNESVADRRGLVGLERGAWGSYRSGSGGICDRERNGRQHCKSVDALRGHGIASHLWPRAAHGSHDSVLVARQTRAHGAQRGRHNAGAESDFRAGCRRSGECAEQADVQCRRGCEGTARRVFPGVDEGGARYRCGPRGA